MLMLDAKMEASVAKNMIKGAPDVMYSESCEVRVCDCSDSQPSTHAPPSPLALFPLKGIVMLMLDAKMEAIVAKNMIKGAPDVMYSKF